MKKKLLFSVIIVILIMIPINTTAADNWITINLVNSKSNVVDRPDTFMDSNEIFKNLVFNGTVVSDKYTVTCNLKSVKLVTSGGLVTQIKVKKSEASKLIVNITPSNTTNKIICNKFMPDSKYAYSTARNGTRGYDKNNPGVEYFYMGNSLLANMDTYATTDTYHFCHFYNFNWLWDSTETFVTPDTDVNGAVLPNARKYYPFQYLVCAEAGFSGLCIKGITNAERDNMDSFTVEFSMFTDSSITNSGVSSFVVAGNGTSTGTKTGTGVYLTTSATVSNNIKQKGANDWFKRVQKAMTGLERYINLATIFYLGISILTSVLALVISTVKLATMPAHPIKRREVTVDLIYSVLILALTGGVALFTQLIVQIIFPTA